MAAKSQLPHVTLEKDHILYFMGKVQETVTVFFWVQTIDFQ